MIDDLRNSASSDYVEEDPLTDDIFKDVNEKEEKRFMGMTAAQRFVIALFVFFMVAILGVFVLIVFQKIYPPI